MEFQLCWSKTDPMLVYSCSVMMTPWYGDVFLVIGPLWVESIDHQLIPITKSQWCVYASIIPALTQSSALNAFKHNNYFVWQLYCSCRFDCKFEWMQFFLLYHKHHIVANDVHHFHAYMSHSSQNMRFVNILQTTNRVQSVQSPNV